MASIKLGVVLINWNSAEDTIECIRSIRLSETEFGYTIIVVDNGSKDDSLALIRKEFPDLVYIESAKNLGFAGGNNLGIRKAFGLGCNYLFLLNNDTVIDKKVIDILTTTLKSAKSIGAVAPKMYFYNKKNIIWWAGGRLFLKKGIIKNRGFGKKDRLEFDDLYACDYLTGCAIMIKKEVIDKIGLLSEEYFHTAEDVDWSLRMRKVGYRLIMDPKARIWHKISRSGGGDLSPFYMYYLERNRLFLMKKFGYWGKLSYIILLPVWFKRILAALLKARDWYTLKSIFWAIYDFKKGVCGCSSRFIENKTTGSP